MLKKLVAPALVLVCAGLALAQPETTTKQPKKGDHPPAKLTPPKETTKDAKQEASLAVGDRAPAINIDKWVKGEPVTGFEKGKVYVVEFWATWCGPCLKSIPHLTELQKAHKDITVVGVASSERKEGDGTDNRLTKLQDFVTKKGDEMGYTIGYDSDRQMADAWLKAAGKNTIPTAFIVGSDNKVAWIGNPLDKGFDAELEKALKNSGKSHKDSGTTDSTKPAKKDPTHKEQPKKDAPKEDKKK
jgi:thiol-disulfide isomerase/thioredoxin